MKRDGPENDGPSSFLAKEAPLLAFDRQRNRRVALTGDASQKASGSGQHILAPGVRVAEHYEVGPIIGAGVTGIVYKARHVERGELVALKVMRPDIARDSSLWRRFSREARALSALNNKHVVRVHDAGTLESDLRYLIMDLLTGSSLRAVLQEEGALAQAEVVDYVIQVCSALSDAHRSNIVHRDIRPENVFLAHDPGAVPTVKLLAFGMALILDEGGQQTATVRLGASPEYLSPEQLRDPHAVDARSDLWAVGMLMYELLAGHTPFQGLNAAQTCLQITGGSLPRIEEVCPDLRAELVGVIHRCLEVDATRRPQSAEELCLALEPFSGPHLLV